LIPGDHGFGFHDVGLFVAAFEEVNEGVIALFRGDGLLGLEAEFLAIVLAAFEAVDLFEEFVEKVWLRLGIQNELDVFVKLAAVGEAADEEIALEADGEDAAVGFEEALFAFACAIFEGDVWTGEACFFEAFLDELEFLGVLGDAGFEEFPTSDICSDLFWCHGDEVVSGE
jgi:hypothetical protein